ncbi:hypothetical protein HOI83_04080 [Candidatus Uhrbacteria bacterium]|nr:hypothetical protein [Candidatus Uhrbacteria bacterium]
MRLKVMLLVLFGMMMSSTVVKAEGLHWTGFEVFAKISGEHKFNEHVGFRGEAATFLIPKHELALGFFYVGPTFETPKNKHFVLWATIQAVAMLGEDTEAIGPSLWANIKVLDGKLSVFLLWEARFPFDGSTPIYFGVYSLSVHPDDDDLIDFGWHVEQEGLNFATGPQFGVKLGPVHFGLSWNLGEKKEIVDDEVVIEGVTAVRLTVAADF